MTGFLTPTVRNPAIRALGFALAILSVTAAALPGAWLSQPPLPFAVLWAAYSWAGNDAAGWGAPALLALFGLVHDLLAGGPIGLFVVIYLSAFLIGRIANAFMSAPTLVGLWGGFTITLCALCVVALFVARIAVGSGADIGPFAQTAAITAALYPLARPLYADPRASGST